MSVKWLLMPDISDRTVMHYYVYSLFNFKLLSDNFSNEVIINIWGNL